jgi:hypothetical protein
MALTASNKTAKAIAVGESLRMDVFPLFAPGHVA